MAKRGPDKKVSDRIDAAVKYFLANQTLFENFAQVLMAYFQNDVKLAPFIHFIRYRIKDPAHLRAKLIRKAIAGEVIDEKMLFDRVTDLAGVRAATRMSLSGSRCMLRIFAIQT